MFEADAAASGDTETAQTLELMQGIVVLSSVMNAIAEAVIDQGMDGMSTAPVTTGSDAEPGLMRNRV